MDVLRDVVKPKSVWRTLANPLGAIQPKLRVVRLKLRLFIAPRVELPFEPTARCSLPFGFGGKTIVLTGFL